jgi:hypothetical protein
MAFLSLTFGVVFFFTNKVYQVICKKPERDEDPIIKQLNMEIMRKMSNTDQTGLMFGLDVAIGQNNNNSTSRIITRPLTTGRSEDPERMRPSSHQSNGLISLNNDDVEILHKNESKSVD